MKKALSVLLVNFIISAVFAKTALLPQKDQKPQHWVEFGIARTTDKGIEKNTLFLFSTYHFDLMPFEGYATYQTGGQTNDLSFSTLWWPFYFNKRTGVMHLGFEGLYHYQQYSSYSIEHDLIASAALLWNTDKNFSLTFKLGYTEKIAYIPAIEEYIHNHDIAATLLIDKIWQNGLEAFAYVGSHDDARYPLFFAPRCRLGIAENFNERFRLAFELNAGFTDYFATALYLNSVRYKLSGRVSF